MKLAMMARCTNSLPYFDQWEAEAAALYVPYYENALQLSDLFRLHNEHRILFTNVYNLVLLVLNGQWDSQVQMFFNALLHCATVAGFAWFMARILDRRYWPFLWLALAAGLVSPFGWENALWGFQSQFYFLLLFSLTTICLFGIKPASTAWRWGWLAGLCAMFTMASGLLAFVAVGAVAFLEILRNRREWRRHFPTLAFCALMAFAGLLLVGKTTADQHAAAASIGDFLNSLGNNLSWPTGLRPWLAPLNLLPLLLLAWVYFRSPEKEQPAERIVLGVGFWTILQSTATAVARGLGGQPPAWRYMDTLCFLFTANVLSLLLLYFKYRDRFRFRPAWCAAFLIWFIPCVLSLSTIDKRAWNQVIPVWARYQDNRIALTREFLAKNDEQVFANRNRMDLPEVYVPELVFLLRTKDIPPILPACVRAGLQVVPRDNAPSGFVAGGSKLTTPDPPTERCLGSYSGDGAAARGTFESAPMTSSLPYLEIPVAGNLGQPGLSLQLVELDSGKVFDVKPAREPGGQWMNVDLKAPSEKFKLVARDDSATGWFAFKAPREMGRLSFWAAESLATANYLAVAGLLSLAAALIFYCLPVTPKSAEPAGAPAA